MIKFPCRCSHLFTLDDEMAGGMIQCPRCGLLNDVPSLNDLQNILPDGTIDIELAPIKDDSGARLAELEADPSIARAAMADGAERARQYAAAKMTIVRDRMGLDAFTG